MARKKSNIKMVTVCDKCGKQPPVDEDNSNENWVVYKTSTLCECGGHWTCKIVDENDLK